MTAHARQRILIVGGGFGGIYTAMRLQKAVKGRTDIALALIDQFSAGQILTHFKIDI